MPTPLGIHFIPFPFTALQQQTPFRSNPLSYSDTILKPSRTIVQRSDAYRWGDTPKLLLKHNKNLAKAKR